MSENIANGDVAFTDTATFGTGCFWCTEALFERLEGVTNVVSGYAGSKVPNPSYEEVTSGTTGAAEVCQITFDPNVISYQDLLKVFWEVHDPTTLNRQGNDVGPQYRSVIFFHDKEQEALAKEFKRRLNESGAWDKPVVTAIEPLSNFYAAENYHQDYYINNIRQPYCQYVIKPKMEKFERVFKDKLKAD
ncbi:peptide-methionine (S)-S-oxide reductase MsrA [Haoranjiania flava]|uniref:Peptide methionine sulfoxide reductase MsrA n=1 Tax=Haoranjiania flava TaxID=1856322 RepID=A0AAE3IRL4_9BACT|nr:peptide-methionine (S)-S-oxide reductase MsrA [Haoranjiania flava]MCU7695116.1 peptide-methionine (S)-S-oxide reductase MsrA [Haoranjiania flava]